MARPPTRHSERALRAALPPGNLTAAALAAWLAVHPQVVRRWRRDTRYGFPRHVGTVPTDAAPLKGERAYAPLEVLEWLRQNRRLVE